MKNRIISLNEAEGIFYPAFDKQLCDDTEITIENVEMERLWDSLTFRGGKKCSIRWKGEVNLGSYDRFLCFLSFPKAVSVSAGVVINGEAKTLFTGESGDEVPVELGGSLGTHGRENCILTEVYLEFVSHLSHYAIMLSWLGLSISEKEEEVEKQIPVWDAQWEKEIQKGKKGGIHKNLVLSKEEGERLRKLVKSNKQLADFFQNKADEGMKINVQEMMREYVPVAPHMYRFVRVKDRGRPVLEGPILNLAIAGYLLENPDYSYQSAKLILALLPMKWYEGPICGLKESQFHHVCFTEDHLLTEVSLALGFLGGIFSEKALTCIVDKVESAWKVVESKCKEPGYRSYMNQGLVGNRGAMIGGLFLQEYRGGYETIIKESYERHSQIVRNYLTHNGHCGEGGGYFEYSFTTAILLWHSYARYLGQDVNEVVPKRFKRAGRYLESLISAADSAGKRIPINCASGAEFSTLLLAFMTKVCDFPEGNNYLISRFSRSQMKPEGNSFDLLLGLYFKEQLNLQPYYKERETETVDREGGLLCYQKGAAKLVVTVERNPYTGHFHEDRGGIILEAEGEILLPDLGSASYANSISVWMDKKEYHNLACPADLRMQVESERGMYAAASAAFPIQEVLERKDMQIPQASVLFAGKKENAYEFSVDTGMLYQEGIQGIRKGKLENHTLILQDDWTFKEEHPLLITYVSYSPWGVNQETGEAFSGRMKIEVKSADLWEFQTEEGMTDWEGKPVYLLRICTVSSLTHTVRSKISWELKKFLPENTGKENTIALQEMLDEGGTIRIEKPGVYEVEDTLFLKSHTKLCFGPGVIIKRAATSIGSFAFTNRGAFTKQYDEDIVIEGLTLLTNGVEARKNASVYGLTGELSFFYVKKLRIQDFTCLDLPKLSFGIHVCTFEDLYLERLQVEGRKDAIHLGNGRKFVIRHGLFKTFDDPIALNAHDYAVANPQMGWIEDGLIEDCYDLDDEDTTGYFCRILAGAWCDWEKGMEIQNSDTVVSNGRVYRAFEKPDGKKYISLTQPSHEKGMEILDEIHWVMVQEEVTYQCGCRNIHFKDIHLQKKRDTALSIHFDHDQYSRSVYPGAVMPIQENIVFDNMIIQNEVPCLVRSITPINTIKIVNSVLGNNKIQLESLPGEMEYPETKVLLMGNTYQAEGKVELLTCEDGRSCLLKAAGNLVEKEDFLPYVSGKVRMETEDILSICRRNENEISIE